MPDLREAVFQAATEVVRSPAGFAVIALLIAVLLCVGAVTTLRWCDARLVAVLRMNNPPAAAQHWHGQPVSVRSAVSSSRSSVPLRTAPGPRDW